MKSKLVILKHIPTGIEGIFLESLPSTSLTPWITWVIKTNTGKEYFAPKKEFEII